MNLIAAANSYMGFHVQDNTRIPRITSIDLEHMRTFSTRRKQQVMGEIMSRVPTSNSVVTGHNQYEKTILRLRKEGFRLIDLQPQEHMLTSVWYRNAGSIIGMRRLEVVMLLWEVEDDLTHLTLWRL
jgi:hypothetical protein